MKLIKDLIKKEGVYLDKDVLCFHLSPIPNWYNIMDKAEITCPECKTKMRLENYDK